MILSTILVPSQTEISGDEYYVLTSIYDNTGSYDQFGLAAFGGEWFLVYSTSAPCPGPSGTYHTEIPMTLTPNTYYTFAMNIATGGYVDFVLYAGQGTSVILNSWEAHTGATYFDAVGQYVCNGVSYNGYTDYEEVYLVGGSYTTPEFNFLFLNNQADNTPTTDWRDLGSVCGTGCPPSQIKTYWEGANVAVANFWFQPVPFCGSGYGGLCNLGMAKGGSTTVSAQVTYTASVIGATCTGTCSGNIVVDPTNPADFTWAPSPDPLPYPTTYTVKIGAPSSDSCGTYTENWYANSAGTESVFEFTIIVTGCGGGGCVAYGTPILTPTGYVPIQSLSSGDAVTEYSTTASQLAVGALVAANVTHVREVISVNRGLLLVTTADQPIYIRNSTFAGWLHDPQNLTLSDQVFDPVPGTWVNVTSVVTVDGNFAVYDVVTTVFNTFIADGILLDVKLP